MFPTYVCYINVFIVLIVDILYVSTFVQFVKIEYQCTYYAFATVTYNPE